LKSCHAKIALIFKRMRQKRPRTFDYAFTQLGASLDRIATASPAVTDVDAERERKKKAALERQAKVMAQFKQQQSNFMSNQADIDWGDDLSDDDMDGLEGEGLGKTETKTFWKYPAGTCIFCQEETNDAKPYGTFAMISNSRILRTTDTGDRDWVHEVAVTPSSLDRSAEAIRPFGVSGENRQTVRKIAADGREVFSERQGIGKGFPSAQTLQGPVSVGCGHIMHYACFETYMVATQRRHAHQIARHHPEKLELNEFVCPLCKAQGNAFLPIVWKGREEAYPGILNTPQPHQEWLQQVTDDYRNGRLRQKDWVQVFKEYNRENIVPSLLNKLANLEESWSHFSRYDGRVVSPARVPPAAPVDITTLLAAAGNPVDATPGAFPTDFQLTALDLVTGTASHSAATTAQPSPELDQVEKEVVHILQRLGDTISKNRFATGGGVPASGGLSHLHPEAIFRAVGLSLSAVEIAQRGVESGDCSTFVGKVPSHTLTHLRILGESARSYVSLRGLEGKGENALAGGYSVLCSQILARIFGPAPGHEDDGGSEPRADIFLLLVTAAFVLVPSYGMDIVQLARLCYAQEIVKVVLIMARSMPAAKWMGWLRFDAEGYDEASTPPFQRLARYVTAADMEMQMRNEHPLPARNSDAFQQDCFSSLADCEKWTKRYALVFLRKTALLLHVMHGVDFSACFPCGETELERLTDALKFPTFDEICDSAGTSGPLPADASRPVVSWRRTPAQELTFQQLRTYNAEAQYLASQNLIGAPPAPSSSDRSSLRLAHPGIFELVGLPKNYDTLIEETMKARCPSTGREVSDPMLCLFCGVIVCGQAICCLREEEVSGGGVGVRQKGGAQRHLDV
jgi:E3 ubiquitin-protein ligase UBR1